TKIYIVLTSCQRKGFIGSRAGFMFSKSLRKLIQHLHLLFRKPHCCCRDIFKDMLVPRSICFVEL
ncbi:MAG: hypothetical protein M0Q90_15110, partial [Bacteroidales bacterium]|nr:hypothetical protein [Bacteroidales bacterium]